MARNDNPALTAPCVSQLSAAIVYSQAITANAASTYNTTTYVNVIPTIGMRKIGIQLYATGSNGSANGLITMLIVTSVDGTHYGTTGIPVTLTLNGNTLAVAEAVEMSVEGVQAIKVLSVQNADATYNAVCNAYVVGFS